MKVAYEGPRTLDPTFTAKDRKTGHVSNYSLTGWPLGHILRYDTVLHIDKLV